MRSAVVLVVSAGVLLAQPYDLLIKGGHVIDPAHKLDGPMDVAVAGGKIARVAPGIDASQAKKVLDAGGFYVTPGLIDLHTHVFGYEGSILPDDTALVTGTTTAVDAGGAGWRTFDEFKSRVIDKSKTRVLALINIVGHGMIGARYESNVEDMDPAKTAAKIAEHRDLIVGIKTAHFGGEGWVAIKLAIEAGKLSGTPVMIDDKIFTNTGRTSREKLLDVMRPGDMHTHAYNDRQVELISRFDGKLQPYAVEARRRGVLFDLGHGGGSFLWPVAAKAMAQGFPPDTISTDLHATSILTTESDMPNCISKMMLLGMTLPDAITRSTVNPARAIGRFPELGTLGEGTVADIGVFALRRGVFAFRDSWGKKNLGAQKLECVATVRAGDVVFETAGGAAQREQQVFDLLIRGGHVVDPAGGRNGLMDVAIIGTRIAQVAEGIPAAHAKVVVDARDYYVTPGLIDVYALFDPQTPVGLNPDHNSLRHGVTTAVDAGSSGWKNFEAFKKRVIDRAKIRLLAFLSVSAEGMAGPGGETGASVDPEAAARIAKKYPETIVGIKAYAGGRGGESIERALKTAELSNTIVMADGGLLRPGDIFTHVYSRPTEPWMHEARKRGVRFDVGHGPENFRSRVAAAAIQQGFAPDTISTGLQKGSLMLQGAALPNVMSKLMNCGMTVEQVVEAATVNAAKAIRRPELGSLAEGREADIALLKLEEGSYTFLDGAGEKSPAKKRLRAALTVRAGKVVWDSDGLGTQDWQSAGPYSNFK